MRSSSLRYFDVSGLDGKKKNVAMASKREGQPSMRKKMAQRGMEDCFC
jgi:hypothetical protein